MRFISQRSSKMCGNCVVEFIILNFTNQSFSKEKSTKFIPISAISVLLSSKLVDNKLKIVKNKSIFEWCNFPTIIHCYKFGIGHYIVAIKKVGDYLLIYDPCSIGFKWIRTNRIDKIWSGYYIECFNLISRGLKNKFYIPYPILVIFRFLFIDLCLILILIFLFYLKK